MKLFWTIILSAFNVWLLVFVEATDILILKAQILIPAVSFGAVVGMYTKKADIH